MKECISEWVNEWVGFNISPATYTMSGGMLNPVHSLSEWVSECMRELSELGNRDNKLCIRIWRHANIDHFLVELSRRLFFNALINA